MLNKLNIKAVVIIITSSIVFAFIYNWVSVDGIPFIRKPLEVKMVNNIADSNNNADLKGLQLSDVVNLHNNKEIVFIDARDQWDYSEGHIPRAINIPEFSFEPDNEYLKSIKKDRMIIVYCEGDDCDTSKRLASELLKLGFKNVFIYLGGYSEWNELELPTEREKINE